MTANSERIRIGVGDDRIEGTFLSPRAKVPGVLFVHGWGGSQQRDLKRAQGIAGLGCVCLTFDLRGHGAESGRQALVTREDNLQDLLAAYDRLVAHPAIDSEAIAVVGTSYGGYLAAILSQLRAVRWLALRVPAIYRDEDWLTPKLLLDREDLSEYRSSLIPAASNRALQACAGFRGDVLLVESEFDSYVPLDHHEFPRRLPADPFADPPDHRPRRPCAQQRGGAGRLYLDPGGLDHRDGGRRTSQHHPSLRHHPSGFLNAPRRRASHLPWVLVAAHVPCRQAPAPTDARNPGQLRAKESEMNQTNLDDTLDVLNDLLQTSKDGEAGFHACAEDLRDPQLKAAMLEQSRDCAAAADELERIVLELGGKPKDSTSFAGDLHRRWVDLKSLVTGKDEEAVLNECERGEDVAKHRYQAALEKSLPAEIHQVIERQYQGVLRHHDRVRALRDARA